MGGSLYNSVKISCTPKPRMFFFFLVPVTQRQKSLMLSASINNQSDEKNGLDIIRLHLLPGIHPYQRCWTCCFPKSLVWKKIQCRGLRMQYSDVGTYKYNRFRAVIIPKKQNKLKTKKSILTLVWLDICTQELMLLNVDVMNIDEFDEDRILNGKIAPTTTSPRSPPIPKTMKLMFSRKFGVKKKKTQRLADDDYYSHIPWIHIRHRFARIMLCYLQISIGRPGIRHHQCRFLKNKK